MSRTKSAAQRRHDAQSFAGLILIAAVLVCAIGFIGLSVAMAFPMVLLSGAAFVIGGTVAAVTMTYGLSL